MESFPRGTVTFLFTDIEGSTRLWSEFPEQMPAAYERHDAILRGALFAHGGVVFKTIGDAFQVVFRSAAAAATAALEAQRALHAEPWPLPEPIKVRMALHTGAVDPDGAGDYRSPVLNRLGRLLGTGHGGQTLLSQATMELARDGVPPEATLTDLGEQRLKDLYRPERVWQLGAPGLPDEFPPLRTLDTRPNNLSTQLTQFIGRTDDLAALTDLIQRDDIRLVTLTGTGGMGKTRLALQVGADLLDAFHDGVFVAQLDTVNDPDLVPIAVAGSLGLREDREVPAPVALSNHLRDRELLLILDNFEQVAGAAPFVGELLVSCPGLKVLATSRIRLQLRGEQEYPVRPLALPDAHRQEDVEALSQYESVRLFLERAQAVKPDFAVTATNAPAIAEICTRLDGLPLAIELAAARVRMLPPEAMLRRLTHRLPLLTGGARDLPARQRTLRGAIAWSYELLTPEDQALFRRIAVFAGGATLEAIEAVAADADQGWAVFEGLERLVDQSLVRQADVSGEPRFSLFETIREFGLAELEAAGEAAEAHQRHAMWLVELGEAIREAPSSPEIVAALDRVEFELGNIRAACAWTFAHDPSLAYRLLAGLAHYWAWRSPSRGDKAWVQDVLAHELPDLDADVRMEALLAGGSIRVGQFDTADDITRAARRCEEAMRIAESRSDHAMVSLVCAQLGIIKLMEDDVEGGFQTFEHGIAVARSCGAVEPQYRCLNNAGYSAYLVGDLARSRPLLEAALAMARQHGDIHLVTPLNSLADLSFAEGDLLQAESCYAEAIEAALACKMFMDVSINMMGLAVTAVATGRNERAAWIAGAVASLRNTGDIDIAGEFDLRHANSEYDRAISTLRETLDRDVYVREWTAGSTQPVEAAVAQAVAGALRQVT